MSDNKYLDREIIFRLQQNHDHQDIAMCCGVDVVYVEKLAAQIK